MTHTASWATTDQTVEAKLNMFEGNLRPLILVKSPLQHPDVDFQSADAKGHIAM